MGPGMETSVEQEETAIQDVYVSDVTDATDPLPFSKAAQVGRVKKKEKKEKKEMKGAKRATAKKAKPAAKAEKATKPEKAAKPQSVIDIGNVERDAMIHIDRDMYSIGRDFVYTSAGMRIFHEPTIEQAYDMGAMLSTTESGIQFNRGDFVNYVRRRWPDQADQLLDNDQWSDSTQDVYAWVADKIPIDRRRMNHGLSFSHHRLVAELPPAKQTEWLKKAEEGTDGKFWNVATLRKALMQTAEAAKRASADTRYFVTIEVPSEAKQQELVRQLKNLGHEENVKLSSKGKKKEAREKKARPNAKAARAIEKKMGVSKKSAGASTETANSMLKELKFSKKKQVGSKRKSGKSAKADRAKIAKLYGKKKKSARR